MAHLSHSSRVDRYLDVKVAIWMFCLLGNSNSMRWLWDSIICGGGVGNCQPFLFCRSLNRHSDGTKRDNCPFSMSLLFSFLLALKSHFLYHPAISIFLLYQPLIAQVSHIFHLLLLYFCHVVIILRKIAEQLDNRQSLYFCPNIYAKIILYAFLCSIQIIQKIFFFIFPIFY